MRASLLGDWLIEETAFVATKNVLQICALFVLTPLESFAEVVESIYIASTPAESDSTAVSVTI